MMGQAFAKSFMCLPLSPSVASGFIATAGMARFPMFVTGADGGVATGVDCLVGQGRSGIVLWVSVG